MLHLIDKLTEFGFSKTDAMVYISLVKNGQCSGYKIAKEISLSRSSVYSSIDTLLDNGYIYLSEGNAKEYTAKSPELLFNEIGERVTSNISILKKELSKMMIEEANDFVYNIYGMTNLITETKRLFNESQIEIYLNSDFDMQIFEDEINGAIKRGVRIIYFSFNKVDVVNEKIEHYYRWSASANTHPSNRFMMVVDMKYAINFSNLNDGVGLYTNNKLFIMITAEHIHNDIYLTGFVNKYPELNFSVNTIHENTNFMAKSDADL